MDGGFGTCGIDLNKEPGVFVGEVLPMLKLILDLFLDL